MAENNSPNRLPLDLGLYFCRVVRHTILNDFSKPILLLEPLSHRLSHGKKFLLATIECDDELPTDLRKLHPERHPLLIFVDNVILQRVIDNDFFYVPDFCSSPPRKRNHSYSTSLSSSTCTPIFQSSCKSAQTISRRMFIRMLMKLGVLEFASRWISEFVTIILQFRSFCSDKSLDFLFLERFQFPLILNSSDMRPYSFTQCQEFRETKENDLSIDRQVTSSDSDTIKLKNQCSYDLDNVCKVVENDLEIVTDYTKGLNLQLCLRSEDNINICENEIYEKEDFQTNSIEGEVQNGDNLGRTLLFEEGEETDLCYPTYIKEESGSYSTHNCENLIILKSQKVNEHRPNAKLGVTIRASGISIARKANNNETAKQIQSITNNRREFNKYYAVQRKKEERQCLHGIRCSHCQSFIDCSGIEKEHSTSNKISSRHRFVATPPSTPPGFWDISFPMTIHQENSE